MSGPFTKSAHALAGFGLAVLPLVGPDGKTPGISGFHRWTRPPAAETIKAFGTRFPDANVGIVTSASRLTVVDIDGDNDLVKHVLDHIGDTPLQVGTPSGGRHLYYRSNGERNANLRRLGLNVDVKGTGAGIVAVPPSVRARTGKPYELFGSWQDLARLPVAHLMRLTEHDRFGDLGKACRGRRNDMLFRFALREARNCDDLDALLDCVRTVNFGFPEPLQASEVARVAGSAWKFQIERRNWSGMGSRAVVPAVVRRFALLSLCPGSQLAVVLPANSTWSKN